MQEPTCKALRQYILKICKILCIALMFCMLGIVFLQIILRNLSTIPIPWAEESSIFMMIALGLFGSVIVLIEKEHLFVECILQIFPQKIQNVVRIATLLLQIVFFIVIIYYSIGSIKHAANVRAVSLGISMVVPFLSVPIAFALILLESIFQTIDAMRNINNKIGEKL